VCSALSSVLEACPRQAVTTDAPPGPRSCPMRRRLLLSVLLLAPLPAAADRFPQGGTTPRVPPGEDPFGRGPRLPPWPPICGNPVWLAESAVGRRLPQNLRHAMLRDARALRDAAVALHTRWLAEVASAAGLSKTEARRRLGLPRSPYRSSEDVARILGAPKPAVHAAQARRLDRLEGLRLSLAEAWARALDLPTGAALALIPPVEGAP